MKDKWGWRKKHNLTECGTVIVLGIAKLTLMGFANAEPIGVNLRKNARFFLVGASCARDRGRKVASPARSYRIGRKVASPARSYRRNLR